MFKPIIYERVTTASKYVVDKTENRGDTTIIWPKYIEEYTWHIKDFPSPATGVSHFECIDLLEHVKPTRLVDKLGYRQINIDDLLALPGRYIFKPLDSFNSGYTNNCTVDWWNTRKALAKELISSCEDFFD